MSTHVLLNLLNELWKSGKMQGLQSIYHFFITSLMNSIILDFIYNQATTKLAFHSNGTSKDKLSIL